jgi:hypothetical protein
MTVLADLAGPGGKAPVEPWGSRTPYGRGEVWPERTDVELADGVTPDEVERWVQTASLLHSNGDAIDIAVIVRLRRDGADLPVGRGHPCNGFGLLSAGYEAGQSSRLRMICG